MSTSQDLLTNLNDWSAWSPRSETEPRFDMEAGDTPALVIEATGSPVVCGCWQRSLPSIESGRRYRVEASFTVEGVENPWLHVMALITHEQGGSDSAYEHLDLVSIEDGRYDLAYVMTPEPNVGGFKLNLYLSWAERGKVRWRDARLTDVTDAAETSRRVRLAAVSGNPSKPACKDDLLSFYAERCDEVGSRGVDLIVLPEAINWTRSLGSIADLAETVPGPTYERFAGKARQHGTCIGLSMYERDGDAIYNTGLLIDREGEVAGKYHKSHLPIGESMPGGVAPGHTYPVFDTDFGRVAFMICWDYHFPEVARIYGLLGADVVMNCNMGDGRERRALWEHVVRARAVDNHVHIAAAINSGNSCIVSPRGELLSMTDRTAGAIAYAECDLALSVRNSTGRDIRRRYFFMRRPDTYGLLARHTWDVNHEGTADAAKRSSS